MASPHSDFVEPLILTPGLQRAEIPTMSGHPARPAWGVQNRPAWGVKQGFSRLACAVAWKLMRGRLEIKLGNFVNFSPQTGEFGPRFQ
jgi:hypothetical protein